MYDLSIEGGGLSWNDAFYRIFGYDHSEQANTAEWWATHIHPDDAMVVNDQMDKLRDPSFSGWETSYRFKKADGGYAAVTDHVLIRRDKEGQAESLLGTMNVQGDTTPPTKV
jgi:PAS domain S-box-containing protein